MIEENWIEFIYNPLALKQCRSFCLNYNVLQEVFLFSIMQWTLKTFNSILFTSKLEKFRFWNFELKYAITLCFIKWDISLICTRRWIIILLSTLFLLFGFFVSFLPNFENRSTSLNYILQNFNNKIFLQVLWENRFLVFVSTCTSPHPQHYTSPDH